MKFNEGILWLEWGDEAFKRAESEDKPIILSISAAWCHWCHVMYNTTYADPRIIEEINREYIPVSVDTDHRPDINERYNMGGWPSTVFLTSGGDILTGGTYLPPDHMLNALQSVARFYREERPGIYLDIQKRKSAEKATAMGIAEEKPVIQDIEELIRFNFDKKMGGFGTEPKFPHIDALLFALRHGFIHDDQELIEIAEKTLDIIGNSAIYDKVDGGFFRYSTTRDWSVPHYEKMLEDNAGFLRLYTEAFQAIGKEAYKKKAEDIIRYLMDTLYDSEKACFCGSQDADEDYYSKNLSARKEMPSPSIDKTIYTNWNAEVAESLMYAGAVFERSDLINTGMGVLQNLMEISFDSEGNIYHYFTDDKHLKGLLVDYIGVIRASLVAASINGEKYLVDRASRMVDSVARTLWDKDEGGFYDIPDSIGNNGELNKRLKPFLSNSKMVQALCSLFFVTADESLRKKAEAILNNYAESYRNYNISASVYAQAFAMAKTPPVIFTVAGSIDEPETKNLLREAFRFYYPGKAVVFLDKEKDAGVIRERGISAGNMPVLLPCEATICFSPVRKADDFRNLLRELKG